MGKNKKKDKQQKKAYLAGADLQSEIQRLRAENEELRARLEKIAKLSSDLPGSDSDDIVAAGELEPDVNPS